MSIYTPAVKRLLQGVIISCVLFGCAGPRSWSDPRVVGMAESDVATIRISTPSAGFSVVFDEQGQEVHRSDMMSGGPREMKLKPGRYEVVLRVLGGYQQLSAHPRVYANISAGKTYEFTYTKIKDGSAVRAEFAEQKAGGNGQ